MWDRSRKWGKRKGESQMVFVFFHTAACGELLSLRLKVATHPGAWRCVHKLAAHLKAAAPCRSGPSPAAPERTSKHQNCGV